MNLKLPGVRKSHLCSEYQMVMTNGNWVTTMVNISAGMRGRRRDHCCRRTEVRRIFESGETELVDETVVTAPALGLKR